MGPRRQWLSALIVFLLVAGACGDEAPEGDRWGAEAEEWIQASVDLLNEQGGLGVLPFYADEAVLDARATVNPQSSYEGLDEISRLSYLSTEPGGWVFETDSSFVDTDGYVLFGTGAFTDYNFSGMLPPRQDFSIVFAQIGAEGIEVKIDLPSTTTWRQMRYRNPRVADVADTVAARWIETWSSAATEPASLYADDAVLLDSITGADIGGIDAIDLHRRLEPEMSWTLLDHGTGPAVFPHGTGPINDPERLEGLVLGVEGDDGTGCPGSHAVWLQLDDTGAVTTERRFRAIDDARRCLPENRLPSGWWTGRPVPGPSTGPFEDLDTVTGTIAVDGRSIDIHNGTPTLQNLVGWAMARYDLAELPLPNVSSVFFSNYSDYCDGVLGRAISPTGGSASWLIIACFDEERICRGDTCDEFDTEARQLILHELAHAWTADNVTGDQKQAFMAHAPRVDQWDGDDTVWERRGVEVAAEYIAWRLLDEPYPCLVIGSPSERTRALGFQFLTNHQPLQPDLD